MSDSSRVQLAGIAEVTWGVTPASALAAIRYTTENLAHRLETTRSDEVRSDRQVTAIVPVGSNVEGGYDYEMSFAAHDIYYPRSIKCFKVREEIERSSDWEVMIKTDSDQGLLIAKRLK